MQLRNVCLTSQTKMKINVNKAAGELVCTGHDWTAPVTLLIGPIKLTPATMLYEMRLGYNMS